MISPTSSSPSPTAMASMKGAKGSGFEKAQTPPMSTRGSPGPPSAARQRLGEPAVPLGADPAFAPPVIDFRNIRGTRSAFDDPAYAVLEMDRAGDVIR